MKELVRELELPESSAMTPVDTLLALGATFRAIEATRGSPQPWRSLDLTMSQLKTLMLVVHAGSITARGLADQLGTTPPAVTPLVDRLIALKLVRRETDVTDRRVVRISAMPKALALERALLQTRRPVLQRVWDHVPLEHRREIECALALLLNGARRALADPKHRSESGSVPRPKPRRPRVPGRVAV